VLLRGPVLIGFNDLFAESSGREEPGPYVKVKPAVIGGVLLPFPCPHCSAVKPEMVHPRRSLNYKDEGRGFSWCPACRKRYVLDDKGAPLADEIEVGAMHAPAVIECGGKVAVIGGRIVSDGLKLLGA
jgi:uncharacterized Zn-finger protein